MLADILLRETDTEMLVRHPSVFFSTMPRSGTWYCYFLFEFLDLVLSNSKKLQGIKVARIHEGTGIVKCQGHSNYPEFTDTYHGRYRDRWDGLVYHCNAFDYGQQFSHEAPEQFSPRRNPALRVIYVYRNPLDQLVSAFHHFKNHVSDQHRTFSDPSTGERRPFTNVREYIRGRGLDGYVKQYFTYHALKNSSNLLMISYENFVRNPIDSFSRMLGLIGKDVNSQPLKSAIDTAVKMSSPEKVAQYERQMGHSLAQDQISDADKTVGNRANSHLRGGEIGKWKREMEPSDVALCWDRLSSFGIDASGFITE